MIRVPFVKRKVFRTAKKEVAARPENRKKAEAVRGLWTRRIKKGSAASKALSALWPPVPSLPISSGAGFPQSVG
ncbi:MAG: hypothetical protein C6W56_10085 [Caldibacillus debilis]|nr:MAG: hypothetical protein C6W56_10085 [Caldibacillus debilis]